MKFIILWFIPFLLMIGMIDFLMFPWVIFLDVFSLTFKQRIDIFFINGLISIFCFVPFKQWVKEQSIYK